MIHILLSSHCKKSWQNIIICNRILYYYILYYYITIFHYHYNIATKAIILLFFTCFKSFYIEKMFYFLLVDKINKKQRLIKMFKQYWLHLQLPSIAIIWFFAVEIYNRDCEKMYKTHMQHFIQQKPFRLS